MRDLSSELDTETVHPESWKPRPGDKLVGRLVRYDKARSRYGPCFLAVLDVSEESPQPITDPHLVAVWLSHAVLLEKFKDLRPAPGERLGIKRLPNAAKGYARYVVKVDRPAEVPDWEALDVPDES